MLLSTKFSFNNFFVQNIVIKKFEIFFNYNFIGLQPFQQFCTLFKIKSLHTRLKKPILNLS